MDQMKNFFKIILVCLLLSPQLFWSQKTKTEKDSILTPQELLSSYYNNNFKPFKKKNIYVGLALALQDKQLQNTDVIFETILDGDRKNFDSKLRGGYFIGNYAMIGFDLNYYQERFTGLILKDSDSIQSRSFSRGFAVTPNFRSVVPLTANERLSFFTEIGLTFGGGNKVTRETKNIDEIDKTFTKNFNFKVGISPGVTFFAMENFALEVQLDVLGYELNTSKNTVNGIEESSITRQNIDFKIDILSLNLGLAYYFGL